MFEPEPLTSDHDLSVFDSGKPPLDDWLRNHALDIQQRDLGRTFVWTEPATHQVVGYFTLIAHSVERATVSARFGHGLSAQIPSILIARLALDRSLQHRKLGVQLLLDALQKVAEVSLRVGTRLIVVDAIDEEAAKFYEHCGFKRRPGDTRLLLRVSDVTALLKQ